MPSRVLTIPQAAEKLQMNADIVRDYLRLGKLPGRKVGRAWRVLESDIEHWISTGQEERKKQFRSARGLLKRYSGGLTSKEVDAAKQAEAEMEEAKLANDDTNARKCA